MNENNAPRELDWDDEIINDSGQFILLPEGDYDFTVKAFERSRFPGSEKIPECKKAVMTLEIETVEGPASVKYDLILWSTLEWKISEFFRAIGQKKHGEPLRPRWNEVVGATGRVRLKPRTYTGKDGTQRQTNDVARFYDKEGTESRNTAGNTAAPQQPQATGGWKPGKF